MYLKEEEGAGPAAATGFPMSGGATSGALAAVQAPAPWSTGLFDCFDDPGNCCVTLLFPCITFGQVAEIVDRGSTSCGASAALYTLLTWTGFHCIYSCFYRSKLRAQYGLEESPCADCCVHYCCELCALCQEYRELGNRGFDMTIGWHANTERQQGRAAATTPPHMHAGMAR
ncbi:hypothetical protein SEVIR_1G212900v4 [Setaria viridis]|uniref:Uncharacterized protein n=1 Tax=Setaria viridis TaxID=4556 RepID=A0A4U6WB54_SETVI|nr:cell number regulator 2-like [Setaria viridis]TKW39938.1 hypothetical protein SEVIR_1G212900v2 [Setaria viridis]